MLIADPSSVWMSNAAGLVLTQDLAASRSFVPVLTGSESGAYQFQASEVLRTTIENRGSRFRLEATVTDLATQRVREVLREDGSASSGFISALNELAKRLDPNAIDFSTKRDRALQAFTGAVEASGIQLRIQMLHDAISADPAFGAAYIALAELLGQAGQDSGAVIDKAESEQQSFTPVDRARFDAFRARVSHAPLPRQEQALRAVLKLLPNDADALAALGSVRFLSGDSSGGQQLFRRALEFSPGNQNFQHQFAMGLLETRRFADAEKLLAGLDNNPAVLPELATCILLEGDVNRADSVFNRYLALRPPADPFVAVFRASWLAVSGRRSRAIELLQATNFTSPEARSIALGQIAVWQIMSRDYAGAKRNASLAYELDRRPVSFGGIAPLIARCDEPAAQWRNEVNSSALTDRAKRGVLGYGFFLAGRYPEAIQIWQQLLDQSGGADLRARTMLAGSLDRAGEKGDAQKLLVQPFVPEFGDLYAAISFDEMNRLLGIRVR